jgi:sodium transport system ATP-binding protein
MIEVRGLRKTYGAVVAVDDVSFTAPDGVITGLLGPNGAGKTTVMRMICGIARPDTGEVRVDGLLVADDPRATCARLGALPDASGLYPRLTGRENIRYFGQLQGLGGASLDDHIAALVRRLDLGAVVDRPASGYSQGERRKVALARALVHDPRHVILDEPTNGLDVMTTRSVREIVRGLKTEGRCVVFSSHVMQEVSALCDDVVVMAHGRVAARGSPAALIASTGQVGLEDAFVALTAGVPPRETA